MRFLRSLFFFSVLFQTGHLSAEPAKFKGMVALHNNVRAAHQQPPLIWSEPLSSYAQAWVNHLAATQNCTMMHRPNDAGTPFQQIYGENLFWASPEIQHNRENVLQRISVKEVVNAWAEEEAFYNYQANQCQPGEDCGHYTQMVWHESREIGCAMAICPDQSQIWACNYYPQGNYIGERPY